MPGDRGVLAPAFWTREPRAAVQLYYARRTAAEYEWGAVVDPAVIYAVPEGAAVLAPPEELRRRKFGHREAFDAGEVLVKELDTSQVIRLRVSGEAVWGVSPEGWKYVRGYKARLALPDGTVIWEGEVKACP